MTTTFTPIDLARVADPYPLLAELRRTAPVLRLESGFWAVTGYEAALKVLRERACASGPIAQRYVVGLRPGAARDEMSHRINFLDPPDHTRVRALVSKAFTPRRVANLSLGSSPTALSFAYGTHYCLGASLARNEAEVMLRTLARRWPTFTLARERSLRWHQRGPFRGLDELTVSPCGG